MPTDDMLDEHRTRVITESKWGDKDMRDSLNSNSLQISPVMAAEREKLSKAKKTGDGKGKKRDGKPNQNGQNGQNGQSDGKKPRKELQCSLCGPTAGHVDMHCYHKHDTEEAQKKIATNRTLPDMSKHFKQLDFATKKRGGPG